MRSAVQPATASLAASAMPQPAVSCVSYGAAPPCSSECAADARERLDWRVNGPLRQSARCTGANAASFKHERMSNVGERTSLADRLNAEPATFAAERAARRRR